jgi:hypothetical protein
MIGFDRFGASVGSMPFSVCPHNNTCADFGKSALTP